MQVGVPWEPLMLELSCFRRLWVCIGEAHIPTHMIYGVEINILCPSYPAAWPMEMTALQHNGYSFYGVKGVTAASINTK